MGSDAPESGRLELHIMIVCWITIRTSKGLFPLKSVYPRLSEGEKVLRSLAQPPV